MRFRKISRRWFLLPLILIVFLLVLAFIARRGGAIVEKWLLIKSSPSVSVATAEPLAADLLFNDQPGSSVFSDRIISEVEKAQKSLEIAMYSFTSVRLKEAIYAADRRGVKVTIITDSRKKEGHDNFFADAPRSIKRLEGGAETSNKTILMHHKFALIDRGEANQKLLFGSYNWTDLQEKYDPSFLLVSADVNLISSFGREFDRLANGRSGVQKLRFDDYHPWDLALTAGGYNYEVWFSPGREGDGIQTRLSSLINGAQNELKIMIWDFTDKELAVDIIRRARAGVHVVVITDTWNFANPNSVFFYLLEAKERYHLDNFELLVDQAGGEAAKEKLAEENLEESFDPFLHFHVLIADNSQVLFGTNNWSRAGSYYNDESMMISSDPQIVVSFRGAFDRQYELNAETFK